MHQETALKWQAPQGPLLNCRIMAKSLELLNLSLLLCEIDMTTGLPGWIIKRTKAGQQVSLSSLHAACPGCRCVAVGR